MASTEDDKEVRDRVRKSLESILGDEDDDDAKAPAELGRLQAILTEETEKYYEKKGLVKHLSRSGRTYWVTPEEKERLGASRRRRRKRRSSMLDAVSVQTIAIWVGTAIVAAVLLAYLLATEVIG